MYQDLQKAHELVYKSSGLVIKNLVCEIESQDYSACDFDLNNFKIKFRTAKITPTKSGQFVTFYKRIGQGPILPYDLADNFDFLIVSVASGEQLGQFVFSKAILLRHGVISQNQLGGKRAIRLYPPWDLVTSRQAQQTQSWQLKYFYKIAPELDLVAWHKLF